MEIIEAPLSGVLVIIPDAFADSRGFFLESFNAAKYGSLGIPNDFVQDNISKSVKNTIRGLHYQIGEYAQGKLCQVLQGAVLDVAVDLRQGSPTYGQFYSYTLSDVNHAQIWLPPGFAHGFSVLSDTAIFHYKVTRFYSKQHERAVLYNDPAIGIDWMVTEQVVSAKDLAAPPLAAAEHHFKY